MYDREKKHKTTCYIKHVTHFYVLRTLIIPFLFTFVQTYIITTTPIQRIILLQLVTAVQAKFTPLALQKIYVPPDTSYVNRDTRAEWFTFNVYLNGIHKSCYVIP